MAIKMKIYLKIISLVAIAAIGIGIYAINRGAGNKPVVENIQKTSRLENQGLKPFAKGTMAAMRILDEPLDVNTIAFNDGDGKTLTIADWRGRTVLLNLWATWCPPCRHEMPFLEDLEVRLGSDRFEVVAVSIDLKNSDKPKAFFAEIGLKALQFYWDGTGKVFQDLKKENLAFGMPTTVLIDHNGMALGVLNGPATWNSDEAIALIRETLKLQQQ